MNADALESFLKSMPAENIAKIEVITVPVARMKWKEPGEFLTMYSVPARKTPIPFWKMC